MFRSVIITLLLSLAISCNIIDYERGNGEINSQKRKLDKFNEIQLAGNYEVTLKSGPQEQVVIVTDENLLEFIESGVSNGILFIEDRKKLSSRRGVKIFITYQDLNVIRSTGASVIKAENAISSDHLILEFPGAGLINIEVDVKDLEVTLSGAGLVKLKGRADHLNASLNGVGNLEAFDLISNSCQVTVRGLGGAQVNVKENLNASVNGIGGIKYKGNPGTVKDQVSGIGTISRANETDQEKESL